MTLNNPGKIDNNDAYSAARAVKIPQRSRQEYRVATMELASWLAGVLFPFCKPCVS